MIAKSDIFILVLSSAVLLMGIARWQMNIAPPPGQAHNTGTSSPSGNAPITNPSLIAAPREGATAGVASTIGTQTSALQAGGNQTGSATNGQSFGQTSTSTTLQSSNSASSASQAVTRNNPVIAATQPNEPLYGIHSVVSGDYLARIAQTYGTTVDTLRQINGISGTLIEVGQEIKYPLPAN